MMVQEGFNRDYMVKIGPLNHKKLSHLYLPNSSAILTKSALMHIFKSETGWWQKGQKNSVTILAPLQIMVLMPSIAKYNATKK